MQELRLIANKALEGGSADTLFEKAAEKRCMLSPKIKQLSRIESVRNATLKKKIDEVFSPTGGLSIDINISHPGMCDINLDWYFHVLPVIFT